MTETNVPVLTDGPITVYRADCGFVAADQAGWLEGVFDTPEEALAVARKANA